MNKNNKLHGVLMERTKKKRLKEGNSERVKPQSKIDRRI